MSVSQEKDAEPHVAHSVKFRKSLKSKTRTTSEVNFDDEFSSSSDSYDEAEETETKKAKSGKEKKGKRKGKEKEHKRDDHHALEEGEVKPVEIAEKKEKGKKGTGKKGKKAKDEAPPPEEKTPKEVDIMAELQQMKMLAEGEEVPEVIAVETKPKKKEKAKKKKPRVKVTAEMLEKMRIEQEAETARLALLERQRLEEERLSAIEKDKREVVEQQIRLEQLNKSACNVAKIIDHNMSLAEQEKELMEWELYIACGRLPNPSLCDQMNTYLHRWQLTINTTTVDDASQRTSDVVALLDSLQDLLDTAERENSVTIENYKWIRQLFRDQQQDSLDVATYRLLRNVEKNLHRIDIPTADYDFADENIKFSIWLRVILPIPLPNPRRPPKARLDINFENVNLQSLFPLLIECDGMAIRAMYLKYDHLSDLCSSFDTPAVPEEFIKSLLDVTKQEWRAKLKYKYDNRDIAPVVETVTDVQEDEAGESGKEPTAENETEDEKTDIEKTVEEIPLVPYKKLTPTASEFAISIEDEIYLAARKSYIRNIPEGALNLRKFSIIGGVFHLDLLYQPPQPQHFVTMDLNLTCLFQCIFQKSWKEYLSW
ncbi:unnamed protein product [Acanthoscelides obtectus]|nr:unnamed protein product [Acanthoscelides obtectus]CAK1665111.1 Protein CASC1 [Acanthoscelides obtectus]